MCQSQAVTQANGATNIVIPANSQIVAIEVSVDVVWDGVASTLGVGWTGNATALTAASCSRWNIRNNFCNCWSRRN
jgi:hypothetical protein